MPPLEEQHGQPGITDVPLFDCMVVGLGNPGEEYRGSRHNVGFDVVDALAESLDLRFARLSRQEPLAALLPESSLPGSVPEQLERFRLSAKAKARVAHGRVPRVAREGEGLLLRLRSFLLVKPWTYMNLSGVAVAALARLCRIPPASIFVVYDDLNLPLGRMRIRPEGSPGGHNGMKSLVSCLGTEGFPRLRMGIGAAGLPASIMVDPDFVLGSFETHERPLLQQIHAASVEACRAWLGGVELPQLMNRYNSFQAEAGSAGADSEARGGDEDAAGGDGAGRLPS